MVDFKDKYLHWLKNYFYVGGMPEVVSLFFETKDYIQVRKLQNTILDQYRRDFGKHSKEEFQTRIEQVWNSIPAQLSKENKKYFFGQIKKGSRMKDFELAIQWLCNAGLVHKVNRVSKPGVPLKAYEEIEAFKLFLLDVGLVSAMCNLNSQTIIDGDKAFVEFKGALTENYVLQEIKANSNNSVFYYSNDDSTFELDFLLDSENVGKFEFSWFMLLALLILIASYIILYKTKFGLRLMACGEHPQATDSVGINVYKMRYAGVLISGALGGLGGLVYITAGVSEWKFENGVAGFGFLALAVMIFGQWKPVNIGLAALLFGLFRALSNVYTGFDVLVALKLPSTLYNMFPYIISLIVLVFVSKNSRAPKAEGIPYDKGQR